MKTRFILGVSCIVLTQFITNLSIADAVTNRDIKHWWNWYFQIPAGEIFSHPFNNTSWDLTPQTTCEQNQSGKTWFLAGTDSFGEGTMRECTVPPNKTIVFPIINVDCSTLEDAPFHGTFDPSPRRQYSSPTLSECVDAIGFGDEDFITVTLDGIPIDTIDIGVSSHFQFNVPDSNIAGIDTSTRGNQGKARAGGHYGKIGPLQPGTYMLEIQGIKGADPFIGFAQLVTYILTVEQSYDSVEFSV